MIWLTQGAATPLRWAYIFSGFFPSNVIRKIIHLCGFSRFINKLKMPDRGSPRGGSKIQQVVRRRPELVQFAHFMYNTHTRIAVASRLAKCARACALPTTYSRGIERTGRSRRKYSDPSSAPRVRHMCSFVVVRDRRTCRSPLPSPHSHL